MITLSKSGNAVKFTFDENDHYLQNGTIEVPVNSLALIMDDSDMATFRKSASNDIFVSANYSEFGMSKAELEAWYKNNMVGSSGGGGGTGGTTPEEVQEMIDASLIPYSTTSEVDSKIDESVSGKADSSAVDALGNTVATHTADTTIHVTANEKAAWNAKSDFSGSYNDLTDKPTIPTVPTSNTAFTNDAGYATTGDVQTATADMATKTWVGQQGYLTEHQSLSNYYTKSETSGATEISTALNDKVNVVDNEVPNYNVTNEVTYQGGYPSQSETASTWDDASMFTLRYNFIRLSDANFTTTAAVINPSGNITTGSVTTSETRIANPLPDYIDMSYSSDDNAYRFTAKEGYRIAHLDVYNDKWATWGYIREERVETVFEGGQSADVIKDVIEPTLINKQDVSGMTAYTTTSAMTQAISEAVSGKAATTAVTQVNDALTAHTADTTIHVTSSDKSSWNGAATNASNAVTALGGLSLVKLTQAEYESLTNKDSNTLYIISD